VAGCTPQPPPDSTEGCAPQDLAYWFSDAVLHPKPPKTPPKPRPPLTLADLPPACRQVVFAP
jgi:penicillin-insensitive murein endopeptidase